MERVRTASREAMGVIVELLSHPAHASGVTSEDSDAPKVPEHADAQQKNENSAPPAATRATPTELMLEATLGMHAFSWLNDVSIAHTAGLSVLVAGRCRGPKRSASADERFAYR